MLLLRLRVCGGGRGGGLRRNAFTGTVHVPMPVHALTLGMLGVIFASSAGVFALFCSVLFLAAELAIQGVSIPSASIPKPHALPYTLPNRRPPSKRTPAGPDDKELASKTERP